MSTTEELEKLQQLRQSGALSEEEFTRAKARLLGAPPPVAAQSASGSVGASMPPNQWAMLLHLSQLAGFVVPFAGLIVPIVIWQMKKDEIPVLDVHGKIVVNWIISELIYFAGAFILSFMLIGIPIMFAIGIAGLAFAIIGGIKANNGEVWQYPMSLKLIK
jgi:uncharacterized Tic20 family protein